jgi:hypothetical protein
LNVFWIHSHQWWHPRQRLTGQAFEQQPPSPTGHLKIQIVSALEDLNWQLVASRNAVDPMNM